MAAAATAAASYSKTVGTGGTIALTGACATSPPGRGLALMGTHCPWEPSTRHDARIHADAWYALYPKDVESEFQTSPLALVEVALTLGARLYVVKCL